MLWETVQLAQREIRRNVLRSSLTILGIVIGVAAVIALVTLGRGATLQVTEQIASLGSNLLQVRPGQGFHGPGGASASADPFRSEDAEALSREIPGIRAVAPVTSRSTQAIYGNLNWSTSVTGSTNDYLTARDWPLQSGRSFSDSELRAGSAVCLLGATVKKELFGNMDPLGASIRLEKLSCQVVGVLQAKGQSSFGSDQDDFILIPLRTMQRRIAGNNDVSSIFISARDRATIDKTKEDINKLLRERRHITAGQEDNFNVRDMQEIMATLTGTTKILTTLLGAVAAVSLLVGGIGIMNIMLVSVTERTREIGIRLAIGALGSEVLLQFLVEAVVLSTFGGVVGIILGLSGAALAARALAMPFVLSPQIVVVAFLFSAAVGVIFGYFPARQAARLDPIEALRHE
ncbi:MAG: multidrug ABC transporter substrate-binding protein [Deltaproteobacteria bacterium RIFOXYD12_FULL_57_12]|nr:MAG: multidrug ABC transporter substrate-binding protein [Deltaproteobacteria bacterium RIFOXYD12_FULL_57_12]